MKSTTILVAITSVGFALCANAQVGTDKYLRLSNSRADLVVVGQVVSTPEMIPIWGGGYARYGYKVHVLEFLRSGVAAKRELFVEEGTTIHWREKPVRIDLPAAKRGATRILFLKDTEAYNSPRYSVVGIKPYSAFLKSRLKQLQAR